MRSTSRSLELFGEEDDRGGVTAADETEEGGLGPRCSCMTAHGITIKGTAGATMELGELPRSKNAPENKVIHGGGQLVCMSEPVVWTPIRIEGWRIPLIPAARVATVSGGTPASWTRKGIQGNRKRSEEGME
ncbi:hypothetical protein ACQJBY_038719 [Aegilops geniculata]